MDLRRYQPLRAAGATWREIADEVGVDWRTVKKYLSTDAPAGPPTAPSRKGAVTRKVDAVAPVIDAWLAADPRLKASVIHERLVAEHGFTGHYQRIKLYVAEARQRLAREDDGDERLSGLHRRFEVLAGAQAQVDWGDEGQILLEAGIVQGLLVPHDAVLLAGSVLLLHHESGSGHVLRLPPPGVRPLRRRPGQHRLRPDQDRRQTPCRPARGGAAAPGGGRVRRALRVRHRRAGRLSADREGSGGTPGRDRARPRPGRAQVHQPGRAGRGVWPSGCRSAAARSIAPTASSSGCAPRPITRRCGRCRSCPTWSASAICAGSGGTA